MRVLVACEYSGRVRDAFIRNGHDAMSVDLLPTDQPGPHYQGDVFDVIDHGWDLMVAHPPCTYLTNAGVRWLYERGTTVKVPERWALMEDAAQFFRALYHAPIPRVAVENPIMHSHGRDRAGVGTATQYVQPWQFGHGETKRTGLWLRGLPPLTPTQIVEGRKPVVHFASPGPDRWKLRSLTYQGIADAMGDQWGNPKTPGNGSEES